MSERRNPNYKAKKIKNIYPSDFALQSDKKKRIEIHNAGYGPDAEPLSQACPHCGVDIPDVGKLKKCTECGSDNLAGVRYSGR